LLIESSVSSPEDYLSQRLMNTWLKPLSGWRMSTLFF